MELDKVREIIFETAKEFLSNNLASDIAALATVRIFAQYVGKADTNNKEEKEGNDGKGDNEAGCR